jgi:hypothetical protein
MGKRDGTGESRAVNFRAGLKRRGIFWVLFLLGAALFPRFGLALNTPEPASSPVSSWNIDLSRYALSAHGTQGCEVCHGTMKEKDRPHPDTADPQVLSRDAVRQYDYKRCGTCHFLSWERNLQGAHAKALEKEQELEKGGKKVDSAAKAPTCGDCHNSHYEKAHRSRLELGREMTERCGVCHQSQRQTYLDNYHGQAAVGLGNTKAASCTDCHGAHQCLSLKDPNEALKACRRCHSQATLSFAGLVIHPAPPEGKPADAEKAAKVRVIRLVAVMMGVLVLVVVLVFYGHSFLWLLREIHEKLKRHPS